MSGPAPAVAACRLAVRRVLAPLDPAGTVLVACSGGADSLALLTAAIFEGRERLRVIGVCVDHGLQEGSADRTATVVAQMAALGADETASIRVRVADAGGVEGAARHARYAALGQLADHFGAARVLLGHTRDDQAETVLLGLARGSGGRSLTGMRRSIDGRFERPLLDLTREQTEAACRAQGVSWWTDPHNDDPRFTRSRVRHTVLPTMERELGPGIGAALARTGEMLREDMDALDDLAEAWLAPRDPSALPVPELAALARAVRTRCLRLALLRAGCPPADLTRAHVLAVEQVALTDPGGRSLDLPGGVRAQRFHDRLRVTAAGA